jgi:CRISPR-associated protein Csx10
MNGFRYTLRLLEPVLANSLAGDSNSAQTLPYIPGGLVRGALAAVWLRGKTLAPGSNDEATFRRLFVRPTTRYLHAYPAGAEQRMLPTPLSWNKEKHTDGQQSLVYDLAFGKPERDGEPLNDLRPIDFRFYRRPAGDQVYYSSLGRQVYVHTQRDAVLGRASADRGTVYRYESLPAGSRWLGIILTETEEDAAILKRLLENLGDVSLGKARSAGYGQATVEAVTDLNGWEEAPDADAVNTYQSEDDHDGPTPLPPPATLNEFWLVCLSPLLARDENGQPGPDPTQALGDRLGAKIEVKRSFRRPEVVGGFNRKWGTYLPQAVAAAAGTVFYCRVDQPVSWASLEQLVELGLGERRGEGFGRVAVKWIGTETLTAQKDKPQPEATDEVALSEADRALAELMLKRMLRRRLDAGVVREARRRLPDERSLLPSPSQIGRWQVIVRNALAALAVGEGEAAAHLAAIQAFAKRERDRNSRAWQKMNRTRLVGEEPRPRLTDWIDSLLIGERNIWGALVEQNQPRRQTLGDVTVEPDETMRVEYTLRLIDAVLRNVREAAKREDRR